MLIPVGFKTSTYDDVMNVVIFQGSGLRSLKKDIEIIPITTEYYDGLKSDQADCSRINTQQALRQPLLQNKICWYW